MKRIRCLENITVCAVLVLCAGCVSLVEKTGQVLDGSAFAEKEIALYRTEKDGGAQDMVLSIAENKNGEQSIVINIDRFPMMKLRASYPGETGDFYLLSLEYLGGNIHGWNEYTLEMAGSGSLALTETAAVISMSTEIEPVQITAGRIHRYDTRITGGEAVTSLRNRRERIAAVAEWMSSLDAPQGKTVRGFEKYWKPVLFPETVSGKKRPSGWKREDDQFQRAEDIRWNKSYTERVFPQELKEVRNSGTLLKDWEEALSWIYMEYEWKNITDLLSRQTTFLKEQKR